MGKKTKKITSEHPALYYLKGNSKISQKEVIRGGVAEQRGKTVDIIWYATEIHDSESITLSFDSKKAAEKAYLKLLESIILQTKIKQLVW